MPLDQKALDELRALDPDGSAGILAQVIASYVDDTASIFTKLGHAITVGDVPTMTREAHSLKSTSRSVGALKLGDLAAAMEQVGRSGKLDGCAAMLDALKAEYASVESELLAAGKPA